MKSPLLVFFCIVAVLGVASYQLYQVPEHHDRIADSTESGPPATTGRYKGQTCTLELSPERCAELETAAARLGPHKGFSNGLANRVLQKWPQSREPRIVNWAMPSSDPLWLIVFVKPGAELDLDTLTKIEDDWRAVWRQSGLLKPGEPEPFISQKWEEAEAQNERNESYGRK